MYLNRPTIDCANLPDIDTISVAVKNTHLEEKYGKEFIENNSSVELVSNNEILFNSFVTCSVDEMGVVANLMEVLQLFDKKYELNI